MLAAVQVIRYLPAGEELYIYIRESLDRESLGRAFGGVGKGIALGVDFAA